MSSSTVQLNVRLPREVRVAGDEALGQIGLSPSGAIRRLWEKAARRGSDLEEVASVLMGGQTKARAGDLEYDDVLTRGCAIVENGMTALGQIGWSRAEEQPSYDELLLDALYEREALRGTV